MAKFFGNVAYVGTMETAPGVWIEDSIVREYYGDVKKFTTRWDSTPQVNEGITTSTTISIVADAFAFENFSKIRWVEWLKQSWEVISVDVAHPRLELRLGGLYRGGQ
jgi:hypothetical protein